MVQLKKIYVDNFEHWRCQYFDDFSVMTANMFGKETKEKLKDKVKVSQVIENP